MKKCTNCNRKVELDFNYCPYCGVELTFTDEEADKKTKIEQKEQKKQRRKKKILDFLYTLLAWVLILIFAIFIYSIMKAMGIQPNFTNTDVLI